MIVDKELFERIIKKKKKLDSLRPFSKASLSRLKENFDVESTYNSNAIEGNTLTKSETKLVIEKGITIGGKPMREYFEAINHKKAIDFIESIVTEKKEITKEIVCKINWFVLDNIEEDEKGIYRLRKVHIEGASFVPPKPDLVPEQMEEFLEWLKENQNKMNIVDFAALAHEKFVFIHPFIDGNGRCTRLLMNLLLMQKGYPSTIILKAEIKKYIRTLDQAHLDNYAPFVNFIARSIERSLALWIDALRIPSESDEDEFISLAEASRLCSYSQEYLSLLARKGKLESIKKGRNWVTTRKAVREYVDKNKGKL
ncbi:MAG: Fic family protein [Candidatus Woesearchaeota archaeon]|jgi:Fic family protein|nr:Fic family protein [Candidatus Woesearchaeota archaeon]MDP7505906.1 Fic family protein [Candidatus Woesearchaeota archaeon]MDP7610273.1 Fic family protein [Candidatus Woesearchaeota archaeon]|tara:strand:- start:970 stop:1905 length:936 start_codon:yes stop_codon:yes gene_type:complete